MCAYMFRGGATGVDGDLGMNRLNITNNTPKGFSLNYRHQLPPQPSKVAPVPPVPPKPKNHLDEDEIPPPPPYPTAAASAIGAGAFEDLPPPPQLADLYVEPVEMVGGAASGGVELAAPSSPVSSSYSELRRATNFAPPPALQTPPMALLSTNRKPTGSGVRPISGREAEIDSLTESLKLQLDQVDDDGYGLCAKCGVGVGGEGGCTAMGKVYHLACFKCVLCSVTLQSQPFYVVDEAAHCHNCYLSTLEKCSVCSEPVTERILRATGKPYHPQCFKCVECGVSLDGVCFTVDAGNRVHCIDCFHRKFAPKCSVCQLPIMPEPGQQETVRVVALDRSFHVDCYKCEDCDLVLSSEEEGRGCYPLDNHVLCKPCNATRVRKMTAAI